MSDEKVTACLAEVRERWDTAENTTWQDYGSALELLAKTLRSLADIPRLLAAAEAGLRPHARAKKPTQSWDLDLRCPGHRWDVMPVPSFAAVRDCPDCTYREFYGCVYIGCREDQWPCKPYRDITTALLGEVPADGG